jgi:hypothetical protein
MKKIREEKEEERRKVLDIEEEKFAAERRREHIEKAKQLQYYDTDRIRTFHVEYNRLFVECCPVHNESYFQSALLLGEVLKERDLQLDMKKRMEEIRQIDEDDARKRYQDAQNDLYRAEREKNENKAR